MNQIDFLATQAHYIDHLAPIWEALHDDNVGTFYMPHSLLGHAQKRLKHHLYLFTYDEREKFSSYNSNPILVASYGDMKAAHRSNSGRRIFMMEHGTGHTFGTSAYPNGPGERDVVSLFLAPNEYTKKKIQAVRYTPVEVIGTPKMDWTAHEDFPHNTPPTVCISFHHGNKTRRPPEASSAFEHYKDVIASLKPYFRIVAHGHPLSRVRDIPFFKSIDIPFIHDFEEVLQVADVYVNDLSSTLYEFITTGKPVVVLNAPWFRRDVHHGLRFWDYSNIGIQVNEPYALKAAIQATLSNPQGFQDKRLTAVRDLYPYHGHAAERAAGVIREYLKEKETHGQVL